MALKREDFLKQLLATFRVEGEEHVQKLTEGLLAIEKEKDPGKRSEIVESIYREAHSLKGAARAVSLRDIEILCQAMESVLGGFKRGELECSAPRLDLLHGANDLVGRLIANPGEPPPEDLDQVDRFIKDLEKAAAGQDAQSPVAPTQHQPKPAPPVEPAAAPAPVAPPAVAEPKPAIAEKLKEAMQPEPSQWHPARPVPSPQPAAPRAQTIRVTTTQLDAILRQTEELVGVRLMLEYGERKAAELHGSIHDLRRQWKKHAPAYRDLKKRIAHELDLQQQNSRLRLMKELLDWLDGQQQHLGLLESQTREMKFQSERDRRALGLLLENLRNGVRQTLMLPFSHLLASFPKMVHDLARDLGKLVEFSIEGDQVQVDKRILEELKDPLVHLVRNALDHGLETAEIRRAANKPETGSLRLAIAQIGNGKIGLTLADDGRGLDPARLRGEAVKRNLMSPELAQSLTDDQAIDLIFHSGFSTSAKVTDLSGRGLGMAIVREKIKALGGELNIESKPGRGASFRIVLPASMATTRGILVEAGGKVFCLPTSGIERVIRFKRESLESTQGAPTVMWQDRHVSFVPLERLLHIPPSNGSDGKRQIVALMIEIGEERLAVGVNRLIGEQEVLVKGLGANITRLRNIAGITVLGTGELVPILHLPDLIESARGAGFETPGGQADGLAPPAARQILVADDSVTTRTLIKQILEDAGYTVTTAIDGAQAFDLLRQGQFDLLLSDAEMPNMNGFELCRAVRGDHKLAGLPVILCTSLGTEQDRRRGLECGATAYIVKRDLEHGQLTDLVSQIL